MEERKKLAITVEEMAVMLGISKVVAYELVKREGFPAIRISERCTRIPLERLKRWLDEAPTVSEEEKEV